MIEIDVAIAEAFGGWERVELFDRQATLSVHLVPPGADLSQGVDIYGRVGDLVIGGELPRYSTDLNACFEAQAKCIEQCGMDYGDALAEVLGIDLGNVIDYAIGVYCDAKDDDVFAALATATAEQRCKAMLRAIEGEDQ